MIDDFEVRRQCRAIDTGPLGDARPGNVQSDAVTKPWFLIDGHASRILQRRLIRKPANF
jgi:hypothetical protein